MKIVVAAVLAVLIGGGGFAAWRFIGAQTDNIIVQKLEELRGQDRGGLTLNWDGRIEQNGEEIVLRNVTARYDTASATAGEVRIQRDGASFAVQVRNLQGQGDGKTLSIAALTANGSGSTILQAMAAPPQTAEQVAHALQGLRLTAENADLNLGSETQYIRVEKIEAEILAGSRANIRAHNLRQAREISLSMYPPEHRQAMREFYGNADRLSQVMDIARMAADNVLLPVLARLAVLRTDTAEDYLDQFELYTQLDGLTVRAENVRSDMSFMVGEVGDISFRIAGRILQDARYNRVKVILSPRLAQMPGSPFAVPFVAAGKPIEIAAVQVGRTDLDVMAARMREQLSASPSLSFPDMGVRGMQIDDLRVPDILTLERLVWTVGQGDTGVHEVTLRNLNVDTPAAVADIVDAPQIITPELVLHISPKAGDVRADIALQTRNVAALRGYAAFRNTRFDPVRVFVPISPREPQNFVVNFNLEDSGLLDLIGRASGMSREEMASMAQLQATSVLQRSALPQEEVEDATGNLPQRLHDFIQSGGTLALGVAVELSGRRSASVRFSEPERLTLQ